MVKNWKKLCRLICASAVIGTLLFPGQIMAAGGVEVSIPVSVTLENAAEAGDASFEVTLSAETAGAPMPAENVLVFEGEGTAEFGPMSYEIPGDYQYSITQTQGGEESCIYDTTSYALTVRVVNGEDGALHAEVWAIKDGETDKTDAVVFANKWVVPTAVPTATPEPTVTPDPTETPEPTEAPEPTDVPEADPTEVPESTGTVVTKTTAEKKSASPKTADNTPVETTAALAAVSALAIAAVVWKKYKKTNE